MTAYELKKVQAAVMIMIQKRIDRYVEASFKSETDTAQLNAVISELKFLQQWVQDLNKYTVDYTLTEDPHMIDSI